METKVALLHRHPQYLLDCCKLINSEWKRNETARLHSLESSCDSLPTCLILLKDQEVIGHLRLSPIPSLPQSCFVETVVVDKKFRGQGFGSLLMKHAEEYARTSLKVQIMYLTTRGQEEFYKKLGYEESEAVSIYGLGSSSVETKEVVKPPQKVPSGVVKGPPPPPMPVERPIGLGPQKTYMKKQLVQIK